MISQELIHPAQIEMEVFMKKSLSLIAAGILCASCLVLPACNSNDQVIEPEPDETEALLDIDPVGAYSFDSIQIEKDGEITAFGLGADWDGVELTEDYATADLSEDGTVMLHGALEAEGSWSFDDTDIFQIELALDEGAVWGQGISTDGEVTELNIDIHYDDESLVSYFYSK